MFARIVESFPKIEKEDEFLRIVRTEVLPILKKQPGFLELLPFVPEVESDRFITITLWAERRDAERYVREVFPAIVNLVKPYLRSPLMARHYTVETSLCPHLTEAFVA